MHEFVDVCLKRAECAQVSDRVRVKDNEYCKERKPYG